MQMHVIMIDMKTGVESTLQPHKCCPWNSSSIFNHV